MSNTQGSSPASGGSGVDQSCVLIERILGLSAALFTFQSFWLCNLRYVYVLFPLYILMARVSRRNWIYYTLTGVSLVGLALLSMQFARGHWAG